MFRNLKRIFQSLEHTFQDLEHTFQALEYKTLRRELSSNCLTKLQQHTNCQEEAKEEDVSCCGAKNLVEGFAIEGFELAIGLEMKEKIDEIDDRRETDGEGGDEE